MNHRPPVGASGEPASQQQPVITTEGTDKHFRGLWRRIYKGQILSGSYLISGVVIGLLFGFLAGHSTSDLPIAGQSSLPSMSQCVTDTTNLLSKNGAPTSENLRDARDHCYSMIQSQGYFTDFAIRKLNFLQQYRANGVLMTMVVSITIFGALLAGFQLWASYQLASVNKGVLSDADSELTIESRRLSLKSSIAGLVILLISFCFFLIFVLYVYRLEAVSVDNQVVPPPNAVPTGELGAPHR
jgi:hypothetical protein